MNEVKIIELKKSILEDNDKDADMLREELKEQKTFYLNVMSSPGSGKTTTLLRTADRLGDQLKLGVMEADIDSVVDAKTMLEHGITSVQLHTGGMCHLDAQMSRQGLRSIKSEGLDLVILENVGNLVCPAEFDTGACKNSVILSVPEGDDKPLKYPLVFENSDAVIINKMDTLPVFDFDREKVKEYIAMRNPNAKVFFISALTGEGVDEWCEWLKTQVEEWKA